MAHHSSQDSEEIRKLFSEIAPLGKVLDLGTPTVWIGFTPEQARDIAAMLVKHAASIG